MHRVRTLRSSDLVLPMAAMLVTFVAFLCFGLGEMGWLIGMSVAMVGLIATMYQDASEDVRFSLAIASFLIVHVAVICAAFHVWKSLPARALSPLFLPDFIAMALLFPKLTGISFGPADDR